MRKVSAQTTIHIVHIGMAGYMPDSSYACTSRKQAESIMVAEKADYLAALNDCADDSEIWRAYGSARHGYIRLESSDTYSLDRYIELDSITLGEIADSADIDSINSADSPADALQDWLDEYYM